MPRLNIPGNIHFVTARTYESKPIFKDEKCCQLFLGNLDFYRNNLKYLIHAYCIMPDHIHLLLYFDMDEYPDVTISRIMHRINGRSAQLISDYLFQTSGNRSFYASAGTQDKMKKQGIKALFTQKAHNLKKFSSKDCMKIWQPGFYDFNIFSDKKLNEKLEYIHNNPLKASLVKDISEYKYCSWRNYHLEDQSIFKVDIIEY